MRDEPLFTDLMTQYGNSLRVPGFALSYWKYIGANSYQKANIQPSAAPYPVILISHGLGTGKMLHTSQAENLASHGYIVMGIDHTYSSAATLFPDGTITSFTTELPNENFQQEAGELEQIWLADIKYILQQLQPLNEGHIQEATSFQHQIDLKHIGIMGHSFGGATAYDALKTNPELIAGINMDGTLTNSDEPDDKSEGNKPFLFLFSDSFVKNSAQLSANTSIPQEARQLLEKEQRIIRHTIQQGGYGVHIQGTEHFNYTDLQLYSDLLKYTGMTGEIDGKRGSELVNKLILQFFDQALKGTATPPWSELSSTYPEVEMYQP